MDKQVFANALSGKPVPVKSYKDITLHGYIIRDSGNFLYVTSTYININKHRKVEHDTELFWVISENLSPFMETRYIVYKTKEMATDHMVELGGYVEKRLSDEEFLKFKKEKELKDAEANQRTN